MSTLDGIILVRHSVTGAVTTSAAIDALPADLQTLVRLDLEFSLPRWPADSTGVDWAAARSAQEEWFETELAPAIRRWPTYAVAYFGMAPIPLALHLGYLLPSATLVLAFQHHHVNHNWRWPPQALAGVSIVTAGLPRDVLDVRGDARVTLAVSYPVPLADAVAVVPDSIASVEYRVEPLALDALGSQADLDEVARTVVAGMESIAAARRNVESIHFFAAGPVGLMFRIGTLVNHTVLPQIVTYQYHRSREERYERAVDLSRRAAVSPLSDGQKATAGAVRTIWAGELAGLEQEARRSYRDQGAQPWYQGLPVPGWVTDSAWAKLASLHESSVPGSALSRRTEERDSFRFDPVAREWVFDDRLLASIGSRISGDIARAKAGRLFLLHEALHQRRQDLDASTGRRIGVDHPSLIEDIDYRADVWAILTELRLQVLSGDAALAWLIDSIDTHLDVAWSFVVPAEAARRIEVRRARRFLIWHWQRELLVALQGGRDGLGLGRAVTTLFTKPEVSIAGPEVHTEDRRIYLRLDRPPASPPELACLDGDQRLKRAGTSNGCPVTDVFEGFRTGDRAKVENAVRAFQHLAGIRG